MKISKLRRGTWGRSGMYGLLIYMYHGPASLTLNPEPNLTLNPNPKPNA